MTIKLMNTTIIPNEGTYKLEKVDAKDASEMARLQGYESYIGHDAAAEAMSAVLGLKVKPNRAMAHFEPGNVAICLKLKGRLPEGKILSREEMEEVGYDLYLLTRVK